jgi:hypothetical protein
MRSPWPVKPVYGRSRKACRSRPPRIWQNRALVRHGDDTLQWLPRALLAGKAGWNGYASSASSQSGAGESKLVLTIANWLLESACAMDFSYGNIPE